MYDDFTEYDFTGAEISNIKVSLSLSGKTEAVSKGVFTVQAMMAISLHWNAWTTCINLMLITARVILHILQRYYRLYRMHVGAAV